MNAPIEDDELEEEPECECVQVDVDRWDAHYCPAHGPHSPEARTVRQQEADEEFEYWSDPGWAKVFGEDN